MRTLKSANVLVFVFWACFYSGAIAQLPEKVVTASFEIIENREIGKMPSLTRHLYIFVEHESFKRSSLKEIFRVITTKYPSGGLIVTILTDKESLSQLSKVEKMGIPDFLPGKSGLDSRKKFFSNTFPVYGNYRWAEYFRNKTVEYFSYDLDDTGENLSTVVLRWDSAFSRDPSFLVKAVKLGYFDAVDWVLSEHLLIDVRDEDGLTPLIWAISLEHDEIARLLVSRGADVNLGDSEGLRPIHYSSGANNFTITDLLLNSNASVNVKDNLGRTPLMSAVSACNIEIARLLLAKGAKLDETDKAGRSVLGYACQDENMRTLLSHLKK